MRAIHERLYFRPLLEAFASEDDELLSRPGAIEARLQAFGFSDGLRTRAAVRDLTRGLTRSSRLMQQILPLLLGWLAESPDPDLGLLNVRNLCSDPRRSAEFIRAFRESPEAARRLCRLVGTTRLAAEVLQRNPELVDRLPGARGWPRRSEPSSWSRRGRRWAGARAGGASAGVAALEGSPPARRDGPRCLPRRHRRQGRHDVTAIAEAVLEAALPSFESTLPFAIIALGRFGGAELSYASDLDVVFVYEGAATGEYEEAMRLAMGIRRFVAGATPAERIWTIDLDLRPEGKQGPLARSVEAFATYFQRWAYVWERQAMLRARPVAGDAGVAQRFWTCSRSSCGSRVCQRRRPRDPPHQGTGRA